MKTKKNSDWVARLVASRQFTDTEAWAQIELTRCALQRLLDGEPGGSREDLGRVGYALNLAWWRSKRLVDAASMRLLEAAGLALSDCEQRGDVAGVYRISGEEKEPICAGINLYDAVLRECSLLQWADAEADFIAQFREAQTAA